MAIPIPPCHRCGHGEEDHVLNAAELFACVKCLCPEYIWPEGVVVVQQVEMKHGWHWTCPGCGEQNFTRNKVVKPTEDELREAFDVPTYEELPEELGGEWHSIPDEVMCRKCAETFEPIEPD